MLFVAGCTQEEDTQEEDAQKKDMEIETTEAYDDECIPKGVYQIRDDSQKWQGASVVTTIEESILPEYDYVQGKYIISSSQKGAVYCMSDGRSKYEIMERFIINVYDIQSGELVKEIDIKEVVENYLIRNRLADYEVTSSWKFLDRWQANRNSEVEHDVKRHMLLVYADKIEDNHQTQKGDARNSFYIDIETGERIYDIRVGTPNADIDGRNKDLSDAYSIFFGWGKNEQRDLFNINGLRSVKDREAKKNFIDYDIKYQWDGLITLEIRLTGDLLPEKNEELYTILPELKQYQGDEEACVTVYFDNLPDPEGVLKLFLEDGQEISYEGFVYWLSSYETIDGERHSIHNFEEFYQWYLPHAER